MMMKSKITQYALPLLIALIFSACGGGGGGSVSSENEGTIQIDISIPCETDPALLETAIDTYILLESGDTISKSGDVTIITYHDSTGEKRVCKDASSTGNAYILRPGS